eukprot:gene19687-24123_t
MRTSSDIFKTLEEIINRLAAETMLAQAGKDDGLVPSYSLMGELKELCADKPVLREPTVAVHMELDRMLDAAKPFDDAMLARLRVYVEWLPVAAECLKSNQAVPPFNACAPAPEAPASSVTAQESHEAADILLDLHLDENRELLGEFYGEAVDHLQQIEAALLALEQKPEDPEALNSIFRSFHTFK